MQGYLLFEIKQIAQEEPDCVDLGLLQESEIRVIGDCQEELFALHENGLVSYLTDHYSRDREPTDLSLTQFIRECKLSDFFVITVDDEVYYIHYADTVLDIRSLLYRKLNSDMSWNQQERSFLERKLSEANDIAAQYGIVRDFEAGSIRIYDGQERYPCEDPGET